MPLPSLASTSALASKAPAPPVMSCCAIVALKLNAAVNMKTTTRVKAEDLIMGLLRISYGLQCDQRSDAKMRPRLSAPSLMIYQQSLMLALLDDKYLVT
jgi:hypothetical protein